MSPKGINEHYGGFEAKGVCIKKLRLILVERFVGKTEEQCYLPDKLLAAHFYRCDVLHEVPKCCW